MNLKLEELVTVFAVLHHAPEYEDSGSVHHEAEGGTAGRNIPLDRRYKPLVRG